MSVAAGSGPRKPHLAPPSPKKEKEKNLHSVDREKYEKNIQSKRRKRKEYVPIRIMNNNLIYSQPDARKSSARRKGGAGVKQKAVSEEEFDEDLPEFDEEKPNKGKTAKKEEDFDEEEKPKEASEEEFEED